MINTLIKQLPSRRVSIKLFKQIQQHATKQQYIQQMKSYRLVQQYSWICLHYWLISSRLRSKYVWDKIVDNNNSIANSKDVGSSNNNSKYTRKITAHSSDNFKSPLLLSANMQICLQQYTRQHTYEYQQYFNLDVYSQLSRRSGTLMWSLQDYYRYGLMHKPLQQIIVEDLLGYSMEQIKYKLQQGEKQQIKSKNTNINNANNQQQTKKTSNTSNKQSTSKDKPSASVSVSDILQQIQYKQPKCRQYISYNIAYLDSISTKQILNEGVQWLCLSEHDSRNKQSTDKQTQLHKQNNRNQNSNKSKIVS